MSKIVSMSSGAIDPINVTKRVFWTPDTTTTILKVGQPVCYSSDSVLDHKGRSVDPDHLGLTKDTYAQGEQEFIGRLFVVEEPLTDNLNAFAGIVKSLGPLDGAIGDMIEIFTPVEGVMVPVYTDENCTEERTILGIRDGEASVSYPGRPIGVAQETINRSGGTSDGMCWMKFRSFAYQVINGAGDAAANALIVDDESGANGVLINSVNVRFDGSSYYNRVLYMVGELAGGGSATNGMFKFRTYANSTIPGVVQVVCGNLHIKDDAVMRAAAGGEYNSVFYATIETETAGATPGDLNGGYFCAYQAVYYVDESGGVPGRTAVIGVPVSIANYTWDAFLMIDTLATLGGAATAKTGDADAGSIAVLVGGVTKYLQLWSDDGS